MVVFFFFCNEGQLGMYLFVYHSLEDRIEKKKDFNNKGFIELRIEK